MKIKIEAFLEKLYAENGASKNTIQSYNRDILDFKKFMSIQPLTSADASNIRAYINYLANQGIKASSRARKLSALRQFYHYLTQENLCKINPCNDINNPKKDKQLPKILTINEIESIIRACDHLPKHEGIRAKCLIEILYATGLRVTELITLKLDNILHSLKQDEIPVTLTVLGKGNKDRIVLLSKPAIESIKLYLESRGTFEKSKSKSVWLFPSSSQEGHLTRQRFGQILKELAVHANIPIEKVSPHILRHAFATHLVEGGADLLAVQKLLGHRDIATTEIYTHIQSNRLKEVILEHHPLSKLQKSPN